MVTKMMEILMIVGIVIASSTCWMDEASPRSQDDRKGEKP